MSDPYINFTSQGAGEPLLIIHGLFGSSRNWQALSKQFAESYEVYTLDLRNHGDTFHASEMSYSVMADDVEKLIDSLALDSINLLGHSMGGKVAMTLCQRISARIKKMVVADIAPMTYSHHYDELLTPILELDLSSITSRKQADQALIPFIPDQRIRLFLLQNLALEQGRACWKINWPVLHQSMDEITGFPSIDDWSIETPTLFVAGEMSDYVDENARQLIDRHFSNSQHSVIENAGHWLHAEQPRLFFNEVKRFLIEEK